MRLIEFIVISGCPIDRLYALPLTAPSLASLHTPGAQIDSIPFYISYIFIVVLEFVCILTMAREARVHDTIEVTLKKEEGKRNREKKPMTG